jgi:hypothetical protein
MTTTSTGRYIDTVLPHTVDSAHHIDAVLPHTVDSAHHIDAVLLDVIVCGVVLNFNAVYEL